MTRALTMAGAILCGAAAAASSATVRYEAANPARPVVATGVERVGDCDGVCDRGYEWNTREKRDGWVTLTSGERSVEVLVLNGPEVVGGRLTRDTTWPSGRVRVVRSDVVVPTNATLTLGANCVVKFLPGARLDVEPGGALRAEGALLADFADDTVGGDTNLDGGETTPSGRTWWREDAATAALAELAFFDEGKPAAPTRAYTPGVRCAALPQLAAPKGSGAKFLGWRKDSESGERFSAGDAVPPGTTRLFAEWQREYVSLEQTAVGVPAGARDVTLRVEAFGKWRVRASNGCDWLDFSPETGEDSTNLVVRVAANRSSVTRTASVIIETEGGATATIEFVQDAMKRVARPNYYIPTPPELQRPHIDGSAAYEGTFSDSQELALYCMTEGTTIRYTTDGSDPTERSSLYAKPFTLYGTTTVKARAFREDWLESEVLTVRFRRLIPLAEAVGMPSWSIRSSGAVEWVVDDEVSADGEASARGMVRKAGETAVLSGSMTGGGRLSFFWRVGREDGSALPPNGATLTVTVDGVQRARLAADTAGWSSAVIFMPGEGWHTVSWTLRGTAATPADGACAWVDALSWEATAPGSNVPLTWLVKWGLLTKGQTVASVVEALAADPDGDGYTTAEEYVLGTDPTDRDSALRVSIEIRDGKPVVTYSPNFSDSRIYVIWGTPSLTGGVWTPVMDDRPPAGEQHFFRVSVEKVE